MKYIKYFENNSFFTSFIDNEKEYYKVGDYVLLTNRAMEKYNYYCNKIENKGIIHIIEKGRFFYYIKIKLYTYDNKRVTLEYKDEDIERKLTEYEIEEYEMKINAKNFNL